MRSHLFLTAGILLMLVLATMATLSFVIYRQSEEMSRLALPQPREDVRVVPSSLKGLAGALGATTLLEN